MENSDQYNYLFELESESIGQLLTKLEIKQSQFKNKTVFLTGGARGIGKATALGLGALGASVVIVDKRSSGKEVADEINKNGGESLFIHKDISEAENIKEAFQLVKSLYGTVDILINNAVHFTIASFEEMPIEEWDLTQRTNIGAMVHTIKLAMPEMLAQKNGVIMNLVGPEGMNYAAAMSSSKVAMRSLLYSLSDEVNLENGVSIIGFAPGFVATPLVKDVFVKYCNRAGIDFEDYVYNIAKNPGYYGLMPVEHCAAGLIHTIVHASEFHGLIADAYIPLERYGIISLSERGTNELYVLPEFNNKHAISRYITGISSLNRQIESKIQERTKKLTKEKEIVIDLLKEIQNKNTQLEVIKDELTISKEKAEQASVHKEEFLTNVTHEIRTPLNAIIGFIDLLKDSELTEEQKDHINAVQISSTKLLKLINEVLDISKIEAGKLDLEPEIFDLPQFVNDLEKSTKARADEKGNALKIFLDPDLPILVKGDPNRLHQILINLIGNAIKFTHHGEIQINTKATKIDTDTYLVSFIIKDTGIGISKENIDSVFETFTQAKGQRNRKHGGSGLGLSIVKKLLELYGGTISLQSQLGKGSEFKVEIPLQKAARNEFEKESAVFENLKDNALEGLNILLAEDNRFNQLLEIRILENLGASVTLAENGREAIDLLKKGSYHLILMDIQMPELDGIDTTRFIRDEMKRDLPIIALTANAFKQELDKCLEAGMNSCVTKPFKKEVLVRKILESAPKLV